MAALAVWDFARQPEGSPEKAVIEGLLNKYYRCNDKKLVLHRLLFDAWRCVWAPGLERREFSPNPAKQGTCVYLSDSGYAITNLDAKTKSYFLTGPAHGYNLFGKEKHIYSYGHHHPDVGSVLLNYDGKWLLADTGYTWAKLSSEHNMLLVDGHGQHNDGHVWMTPPVFDFTPPKARISEGKGFVRCEAGFECYYPKSLKLKKWTRTVLSVIGKGLAIADDVECADERELTVSWGSDFRWTKTGEEVYDNQLGCQLALYGEGETSFVEAISPARNYIETAKDARPWHALRVRTAGKTKRHRFIAIVRLPGVDSSFDKEMLAKLD